MAKSFYQKLDRYILFPIAEKIYGSDILHTYSILKKNDWLNLEELKEFQNHKLQELIKHCYKNVPYYRGLFDSLSLTPNDIRSSEDLKKLPVLTKQIIRDNYDKLISLDVAQRKTSNGSTGGSTGTPLQFKRDVQTWNAAWASTFRAWNWYGFSFGEKIFTIAGNSLVKEKKGFSKKDIFDKYIMQNFKHNSFEMKEDDMKKHYMGLLRVKPAAIRGYASTLYLFALYIEKNKLPIPKTIRLLLTTGEILLPQYRRKLQEVFRVPLYDNYGAGDGGIASYECYMHEGLHISEDRCVIEIVDENDDRVSNGTLGHVLTTDLDNYAFPFIRYKVGDMAYIKKEKCSCGRSSRLIGEVVGRAGKLLYNKKGEAISPTMLPILLYKDLDYHTLENQQIYNRIDKFRINQNKNGDLDILLKLKNAADKKSDFDYIIDNYKTVFPDSEIEVKFVEDILPMPSGKEDYVYSEFTVKEKNIEL
jgi:phenylacetate-CoA ligase